MNNDDKFKIVKYLKEFILYLDDYIINFPKKEFELKNRFVNDSYELLELLYLANYLDINDRKDIQRKIISKVNIIDFYLELSYKKHIISERQLNKLSSRLLTINKLITSWVKYAS